MIFSISTTVTTSSVLRYIPLRNTRLHFYLSEQAFSIDNVPFVSADLGSRDSTELASSPEGNRDQDRRVR